jgi:hypothetical protein
LIEETTRLFVLQIQEGFGDGQYAKSDFFKLELEPETGMVALGLRDLAAGD